MPLLTSEIRSLIITHLKNNRPDLSDDQLFDIIQKIESNQLGFGLVDPNSNTVFALGTAASGQ